MMSGGRKSLFISRMNEGGEAEQQQTDPLKIIVFIASRAFAGLVAVVALRLRPVLFS